jgi:small subunit ribosomal protein S6
MPVRPYEIVYIIDPDLNEVESAALVERFRALAEAQGVTDLRVDTTSIGKRRLAYIINHKREGHYVVMHFQGEAKAPAEVQRVLNIADGVLRSMVVRLEVMPPVPEPPPAPPVVVEQPAPPVEEVVAEEAAIEPTVEEEAAVEDGPVAEAPVEEGAEVPAVEPETPPVAE